MQSEVDRARSALWAIPATIPRDKWVKIGMAAHAAGLDFADFDQWSAQADNYNVAACKTTWRSIKTSPGGVTAGALFGMARDCDWTEGKHTATQRPAKPAPEKKPAKPEAPPPNVATVWARCLPATAEHGYIARKAIESDFLDLVRVVPMDDPLTHYRGWLAVPGYIGDMMTMIEFVPPGPGEKRTIKGGIKSGASLTVGIDGGPVYVGESIGVASANYSATGCRATACFGSSNIKNVVADLRQREPVTEIILTPDRGKEVDALTIAAEFNCKVVCLPEGEPSNFDVNDLLLRDGVPALQTLLQTASQPPKAEPQVHPLARFVDFDGTAKAPRWVIPNFIGHGVVVIAGAHGVGKTTALLPLAMTAAGLHGDDLMPRQWRHVIYITEDVEQSKRIMAGIVGYSNLCISLDQLRERLHIVEATRLAPAFVATVGTTYRQQFTRTVEGVEVLPLVVLDTKSAVLALENENDNSEASAMMASLKQGFDGLPVWLIGHVAKTNLTRSDVSGLTSRGASAIEGDANQTMFLVREGESRYLVLGKTRFEAKWPELEITSYTAQAPGLDEFGNTETIVMRWGIAAPAQQSRKDAAEQAAEQQRQEDETALRQDIRDAVDVAWQTGNPLNREGIKAKLNRKAQTVLATVEILLHERWLHEVFVPAKERLHPRKSAFFVNLTTEEHEAVLAGTGLPADKLAIPQSWRKAPDSIIPAPENDAMEFVA